MNACDSYAASGDVYVLLTFNTIFTKQKLSGVEYLICIYMEYDLVATIFYCCFCCCFFFLAFSLQYFCCSLFAFVLFLVDAMDHTRAYIYIHANTARDEARTVRRAWIDAPIRTHMCASVCVNECEWVWECVLWVFTLQFWLVCECLPKCVVLFGRVYQECMWPVLCRTIYCQCSISVCIVSVYGIETYRKLKYNIYVRMAWFREKIGWKQVFSNQKQQ